MLGGTEPEAWRRRYIKGEKPPPSGSMFLGSRVDDALSAYHRRILEHGDRLALDQLLELYREHWHAELEAEREKQGIDWHEELPERAAFELGRQAIELAMAELVPHLGEPVDVQRRLEFTLAPGLEWLSGVSERQSSTSFDACRFGGVRCLIYGVSSVSSVSLDEWRREEGFDCVPADGSRSILLEARPLGWAAAPRSFAIVTA